MYYIYIISCERGELYTGITTDVSRRMREHFGQTEKCAKFTRSHKATALEALWQAENRSLASKLEWSIKHLTRAQKLELISSDESFGKLLLNLDISAYQRVTEHEVFAQIKDYSCTG